jgi:hypothetical protein
MKLTVWCGFVLCSPDGFGAVGGCRGRGARGVRGGRPSGTALAVGLTAAAGGVGSGVARTGHSSRSSLLALLPHSLLHVELPLFEGGGVGRMDGASGTCKEGNGSGSQSVNWSFCAWRWIEEAPERGVLHRSEGGPLVML